MSTSNKTVALAKLNSITRLMPAADALSFFNSLVDAYREDGEIKRDLARIEATKQVVLAEITKRYDLYHRVFDRIFDERKSAIDRHFEVIDRGIEQKQTELVIEGLRGLSTIVSSSPFANLQELSKLLESGARIEI